MSRWLTAFREARASELVAQTISRVAETLQSESDSHISQELSRLRKILKIIEKLLTNADPELVSESDLQMIVAQNNAIVGQLDNFQNNKNIQNLIQANKQADESLALCTSIHLAQTKRNTITKVGMEDLVQRVEENISRIRDSSKTASDHLDQMDFEISQRNEQLALLDQNMQEQNEWIASTTLQLQKDASERSAEWQTEFSDKQSERHTAFLNQQDTDRQEYKDLIGQISSSSTQRQDELFEKINAAISTLRDTKERELQVILDDGVERHNSIKKLHGFVAEDATSGSYKSASHKEAQSSTTWRRISFAAIILSLCWVAFAYWANGFNWKMSLSALPMTLILASAAGYAGKIAAGHRRESLRVRQFAMEMEAIQPYLDKLDDEAAKKIRGDLAPQYFGRIPDIEPQESEYPSEGAIRRLTEFASSDN